MVEIIRSALVPYSDEEMFLIVQDIRSYQEFLPWCSGSEVFSEEGNEVIAGLSVGYAGFSQSFKTKNTSIKNEQLTMSLIEGPFRSLEGTWFFQGLAPRACKVTLNMNFEMASGIKNKLFQPIFKEISSQLIDAFIQRAHTQYGVDHG